MKRRYEIEDALRLQPLLESIQREIEERSVAIQSWTRKLRRLREDGADELTESELRRVASYTNTQGQPHEGVVADVLTHVVNHASYHRGQIAVLVREAGGRPAVTDFIFFAYREPEDA